MTLQAFALTTLANVKAYIGGGAQTTTTDDSLLEDMINAASRMIISYTGIEFRSLSTTGMRLFPVNADGSVDLGSYALRSVSQVRAGVETSAPVTLDVTQYQLLPVDITSGGGYERLQVLDGYWSSSTASGWWGTRAAAGTVEITGSWGWSSVPEDVEFLCRVQVKQWYERDRSTRSNVVAADDTGAPSYSPALGLAPGIKRALNDAYPSPVIA